MHRIDERILEPIDAYQLSHVVGGDGSDQQCIGLTAPNGTPVIWKPSVNTFVSPPGDDKTKANSMITSQAPQRFFANSWQGIVKKLCPNGVEQADLK